MREAGGGSKDRAASLTAVDCRGRGDYAAQGRAPFRRVDYCREFLWTDFRPYNRQSHPDRVPIANGRRVEFAGCEKIAGCFWPFSRHTTGKVWPSSAGRRVVGFIVVNHGGKIVFAHSRPRAMAADSLGVTGRASVPGRAQTQRAGCRSGQLIRVKD
jgi:hypothetical protein